MGFSPSSAAVVDLEIGGIPVKTAQPAPTPNNDEVACGNMCLWIVAVVCGAIVIGITTVVALTDGPEAAVWVGLELAMFLFFGVVLVLLLIDDMREATP